MVTEFNPREGHCIYGKKNENVTRRGTRLGLGVGLRVGIYGVLSGLDMIVPSGSGVIGVHWWSCRWVSGIIGIDWASVRLSECT